MADAQSLSMGDRERLFGYLEGSRKIILPEPQALLTQESRMPGLDGQKMSKSYGNTIGLREDAASVEKKVRTMPTDPARIRKTDVGDPARCPVWQLHAVYSSEETRAWAEKGCKSATGKVYEGEGRYDLVVRLDKDFRQDISNVKNIFISLPSGNQIPLEQVADVNFEQGPAQISREDGRRRIVIGLNVRGRDVKSVVNDIQARLDAKLKLPEGYYITYGGQFEFSI